MNQTEMAAAIRENTAQHVKAIGEIRGAFDTLNDKIVSLEEAVQTAGSASPEVLEALAEAKAAAQAADDIIPDAATPSEPTDPTDPTEPSTPPVTS